MRGRGALGIEVMFLRHLLGSRSPCCPFTYICFLFIFTFLLRLSHFTCKKTEAVGKRTRSKVTRLPVAGFRVQTQVGRKVKWSGWHTQDRITSPPPLVAFQPSALEEFSHLIYNVSLTLHQPTRTGHQQIDPWPALHSPLKGMSVC